MLVLQVLVLRGLLVASLCLSRSLKLSTSFFMIGPPKILPEEIQVEVGGRVAVGAHPGVTDTPKSLEVRADRISNLKRIQKTSYSGSARLSLSPTFDIFTNLQSHSGQPRIADSVSFIGTHSTTQGVISLGSASPSYQGNTRTVRGGVNPRSRSQLGTRSESQLGGPLAVALQSPGLCSDGYSHFGCEVDLAQRSSSSIASGSMSPERDNQQSQAPSSVTIGSELDGQGHSDYYTNPSLCVFFSSFLRGQKERKQASRSGSLSSKLVHLDSVVCDGNS